MCLRGRAFLATAAATARAALASASADTLRLATGGGLRVEGGQVRTGLLYHSPENARRLVEAARARGLRVAIHAMGNDAVVHALDAIRDARAENARIEHGSFLSSDLVRRIADEGVMLVAQPTFLRMPTVARVTVPSGLKYMPLRALLDAGALVAGSSDAPVASFDVFDAIESAATRRVGGGHGVGPARPLHPEEAITAAEVLVMHTREAARAIGCLDVVGTLEPGKRADFLVLSHDPLAPGARPAIDETVLAGRVVYQRLR
jgi:predicted amidohydrolase YtcJ